MIKIIKKVLKIFFSIFKFCVIFYFVAIIIGFPTRHFLFEPFFLQNVEEGGLIGIKENQYVLVDKITYHFRNPSIGELILFKDPTNPTIKKFSRVVAVSTDRIEIRGEKWPVGNSNFIPREFIVGHILTNPVLPYLFFSFLIFLILFFTFLFYRFLSRRNSSKK